MNRRAFLNGIGALAATTLVAPQQLLALQPLKYGQWTPGILCFAFQKHVLGVTQPKEIGLSIQGFGEIWNKLTPHSRVLWTDESRLHLNFLGAKLLPFEEIGYDGVAFEMEPGHLRFDYLSQLIPEFHGYTGRLEDAYRACWS